MNLLSQVCLFVLEIITSVARLCSAPPPETALSPCVHLPCNYSIGAGCHGLGTLPGFEQVCVRACARGPGSHSMCDFIFVPFTNMCVYVCVWACAVARSCVRNFQSAKEEGGHLKLNAAHFLFKLFEQRRRRWRWRPRWILMSYCT